MIWVFYALCMCVSAYCALYSAHCFLRRRAAEGISTGVLTLLASAALAALMLLI